MAPKLKSASTAHFSHSFVAENTNQLDKVYEVEKKVVGEGSYGLVSKGKHRDTGAIRAIKAINKVKIKEPERFQIEVDIQTALDHPNIVKLYEVFTDAKRFYLVMEMCTGGELFDRIIAEADKHDGAAAFDERGAATYMQQILGAMSYLHSKSFCHRDIKPENFLMQNETAEAEIKVIDFGLAKRFETGDPPMTTKAGTPYYVAPQVLQGSYDEKCDIWSCGVIAYILLCGYPPFYGDNDRAILAAVKKGDFEFPDAEWGHVSKEAKEFIRQMLTKDAGKRPSAAALLEAPWLKGSAALASGTVSQDLCGKLKKFHTNSRMKKVALTLMAQQLADTDLKEMRECFIKLDMNRDGTLSVDEIKTGMKEAKIELPADIMQIIEKLDTDGSGNIDYTEFIAATLTRSQYLREEVLWAAFRVFDIDGDGVITKEELAKVVKEEHNLEYVEKMMKDVDTNSSGDIDFDEFCEMMRKDSEGILGKASAA